MKIVFIKDVAKIAQKGSIKNVKEGYARNFLFRHNLAVPATSERIAAIEHDKKRKNEGQQQSIASFEELIKKIRGTKIIITSKASEKGQLFGSVTVKDITKRLQEIAGNKITEEVVMLTEPLRTTGFHTFSIKLPDGKEESFNITINSQ